ncbi:MAG: acyltransferase family protein [Pseudoclavibacter sp.]|nr:acyltransferase family protein [Pseudoclavibacter sp.]
MRASRRAPDSRLAPESPRSLPEAQRFVPEIQGLRTIALLLVVSFHIWFGRVSGGVDVFLLVSAYLMTRSLTARAETGAWTRPLDVTVRKLARLLPAAVTVVLLTMLAATTLLEPRYWATIFGQALAAASYTMNFWLQNAAVDYFAMQRSDASLYQHFWSLSVQGQVFLLWPLLHLAGEAIARALRLPPRVPLLLIFGGVFAWSFPYALQYVQTDQTLAYFDTLARLWEFAAGSLLALVAPWLRIPLRLRRVLTAVGVAGIVQCGVVLPVAASFPGWPALWPVGFSLLVIAAADAPSRRPAPADPVLAHPVLQRIGGYSYALYLTHWPVLVISTILAGVERPDLPGGLFVLAVSVALAILVVRLVERPAARWIRGERLPSRRLLPRFGPRTAAVVAVCALAALGGNAIGAAWYQAKRADAESEVWAVDVSVRGPQVDAAAHFDSLVPAQIVAQDQSGVPGRPCDPYDPWNSSMCSLAGAEDPEREIVVIGSSHAVAYTGMLWETMRTGPERWGMRIYASPGCFFHGLAATPDTRCGEAWRRGIDYVLENRPDMLVVVGTLSHPAAGDAMQNGRAAPGFETGLPDILPLVEAVQDTGVTRTVVLRDVPRFDFNMYECAAESGFTAPECTATAPAPPEGLDAFGAAVERRGGVWVDLVDTVCPGRECRPSLGGIVTYLDDSHITPVFSRSLAQAFASQVHPHVSWWPERVWEHS